MNDDINCFLQKFNIKLTDQQTEAVRHTDGAVLLLAVPGSGKTTVLSNVLSTLLRDTGTLPRSPEKC